MSRFDSIVIGIGGVGSAALFHLARRGLRVLGIEQFGIGHDRGSSHGETRIIRKAYFEHPSYVPLLRRAYELWTELESAAGRPLFVRTGMLIGGPADGPVVTGVLRSASDHGLDVQRMTAAQAGEQFAGVRLPEKHVALFEPDAGFLRVESCVAAHADQARAAGATIIDNTPVLVWNSDSRGVVVRTADAEYAARSLVIAGGAWSGGLMQDLNLPLEVRRKVAFWHESTDGSYTQSGGFPVFGFETVAGFFYGVPALEDGGVKVAQHSGGLAIHNPAGVDRMVHAEDSAPVRAFAADYLPRLRLEPMRHSVCLYTMSPDEHFIIDVHPGHRNVCFAAGLSGHGFKFASVIGSILADLAETGRTREAVAFLGFGRIMKGEL